MTTPAETQAPASGSRLTRLKWLAILAPVAFVALLEYVVWRLDLPLLTWPGRFVLAGVVILGLVFLYGVVFSVLRGMLDRLERQNRELLALHHATVNMHGELALEAILQKMLVQACELLDCPYGAISVIDDQGKLMEFHYTGIDAGTAEKIGPLPVGHGLLGVVLHEGERLRLPDITKDPRRHGFPEHHPEMHALLAVPIECRSPFRGNLYLTEKRTAATFSAADEETLVRFASQAAIAIDLAHLHRRLRHLAVAEERARIAREMHDGMAQVLAYVNTKAQAAQEHLRHGRQDEAGNQLEQMARAAREVYTDVREGILGLRVASDGSRSVAQVLADFAASWQQQTGISVECAIAPELVISNDAELQLLRIVQEALSNVRKHAEAQRAWVTISSQPTRIVTEVRDDGSGFEPHGDRRSGHPRFGLAIMHERAESVGGELTIDSQPGVGTTVRLILPSAR